jgi:hypothetical protein
MGKPGRPTTDPKYERITARVSEEDLRILEELARDRGCTIGEALRILIRAGRTAKRKPSKKER